MDSFLLPLLVTGLAEIGDPTQLLVLLLVRRFARPARVMVGVAFAALANAAIASAGGALIGPTLPRTAVALLLALALLMIAGGNLLMPRLKDTASDWRLGVIGTSFVAFLILSFGDKSQLAVAAFAARGGAPIAVAAGAALGVTAANLPMALLSPELVATVPVRAIRWGVAAVFALIGCWLALDALRLI